MTRHDKWQYIYVLARQIYDNQSHPGDNTRFEDLSDEERSYYERQAEAEYDERDYSCYNDDDSDDDDDDDDIYW